MVKIAIVVMLSTVLRFGASIRCYECNSANNSMCLDPGLYDQASVAKYLRSVACERGLAGTGAAAQRDAPDMFCRKIVQTILHKGRDAEVRVTRGCGWVRHHRDCYKADNEDHLETACQCFSDHCNGAPQHAAVATVTAATAAIAALITSAASLQ